MKLPLNMNSVHLMQQVHAMQVLPVMTEPMEIISCVLIQEAIAHNPQDPQLAQMRVLVNAIMPLKSATTRMGEV